MESTAAVTLHFEDFAVKNYLFLKDLCIPWGKILICFVNYFDEFEGIFLITLQTNGNSALCGNIVSAEFSLLFVKYNQSRRTKFFL